MPAKDAVQRDERERERESLFGERDDTALLSTVIQVKKKNKQNTNIVEAPHTFNIFVETSGWAAKGHIGYMCMLYVLWNKKKRVRAKQVDRLPQTDLLNENCVAVF